MPNARAYKRAIKNPELRDKFVKSIDLESAAIHVSEVSYSPLPSYPSAVMVTLSNHSFFSRFSQRSKIIVYPQAFDSSLLKTFGDFKSCLIDHEGFHAIHAHSKPKKNFWPPQEKLLAFLTKKYEEFSLLEEADKIKELYAGEVSAYSNQLMKADSRGISPPFRGNIEWRKAQHEKVVLDLEDMIRKNSLQIPTVLSYLTDLNFRMQEIKSNR